MHYRLKFAGQRIGMVASPRWIESSQREGKYNIRSALLGSIEDVDLGPPEDQTPDHVHRLFCMVSIGGMLDGGQSGTDPGGVHDARLPFVAGTMGPGGMTLGHGQDVYIGHMTTGPGGTTMQGVEVQCTRCGWNGSGSRRRIRLRASQP